MLFLCVSYASFTTYIMYTLFNDIVHKNSDSWYIETDTNVDYIQNLSIKCT